MKPMWDQLCCSIAISKPMYINLKKENTTNELLYLHKDKKMLSYKIIGFIKKLTYTKVSANDDIRWKNADTNR